MNDKEITISAEDLAALKELRIKNAFIANKAEKALLEARVSELEYKVAAQQIYLKYGIASTDSIDEQTGKVTTTLEAEHG